MTLLWPSEAGGCQDTVTCCTPALAVGFGAVGSDCSSYSHAVKMVPSWENPTTWTNLLEIFLELCIPFALARTFGRMVKDNRQGYAIVSVMATLATVSVTLMMVVQGVVPVIVTFHDTNDFTASHMEDYLRILVEESQRVGLRLAAPAFYDDGVQAERMAVLRAQLGVYAGER